MSIIPSRRGFVGGLLGLFAAPAIVSASSLMPVKALRSISMRSITDYVPDFDAIDRLDVLFGSTPQMITREAIKMWADNNTFIQNIGREYDDAFDVEGAKIGTTLRIRYPLDYVISHGPSLGMKEQQSAINADHGKIAFAAGTALVAAQTIEDNPAFSRRNLFGGFLSASPKPAPVSPAFTKEN